MLAVRAHLHDQPARRRWCCIHQRERDAVRLDFLDQRRDVAGKPGPAPLWIEVSNLAAKHVSRAVQVGRAQRQVGERLERDRTRDRIRRLFSLVRAATRCTLCCSSVIASSG